jgi:hypothetical protein
LLTGGYAKEMSPEWFAAANAMLLKECKTTNVIITTALIPGRAAPKLILQNMVRFDLPWYLHPASKEVYSRDLVVGRGYASW